jgi:protease I
MRVAVLMESDFYEPEIYYYRHRFAEEGIELDLISRLWGSDQITFTGHEHRAPITVTTSLEHVSPADYQAVIVPSGMVADRLRYSEKPLDLSPATAFLREAFTLPGVLKGVICHGSWLLAKIPETVRDRPMTCHNNLVGDVVNMGARYRDEDVVVDGDLITGRTGQHCHLFARTLIERLTS